MKASDERRQVAPTRAGPQVGSGTALPADAELLGSLQRSAGNRSVARLVQRLRSEERRQVAPPRGGLLQVSRIGTMAVKNALSNDKTYWPIYSKWFRVVGVNEFQKRLEPLEDIEKVKQMLDTFAESKEGKFDEAQLKKHEFTRDFGNSPVVKALIKDIDTGAAPEAQIKKLFDNFKEAGATHFDYTMANTTVPNWLNGTTRGGDCQTVTRAFQTIAESFLGIKVDYKKSDSVGFNPYLRFIAPTATTIDGKTGNVDNGSFWMFDNHYWIEAFGTQYDILFGRIGITPSAWTAETKTSEASNPDPGVFGALQITVDQKSGPIGTRYKTKT